MRQLFLSAALVLPLSSVAVATDTISSFSAYFGEKESDLFQIAQSPDGPCSVGVWTDPERFVRYVRTQILSYEEAGLELRIALYECIPQYFSAR